MPVSGRVVEEQKSFFMVDTVEGRIRSTIRGALKKDRIKICTGDMVDLELTNNAPPQGVITKVHQRTSYLKRPAVANLSQVFFITTMKTPPLDLEVLDRFLFTAQVLCLQAIIVFNKVDLLDDNELQQLEQISNLYTNIGYEVKHTSAHNGHGIDILLDLCSNKISAFAGLSGVGKSSLLAKIFPEKDFRIGNVSGIQGRGTHTTTNISLLSLKQGGYIADTPGLSFVDIPAVPEEEVATHFPELASRIGQCRFNNCIHHEEPGCLILSMVNENKISASRHKHYLKFYKHMREIRKKYLKD